MMPFEKGKRRYVKLSEEVKERVRGLLEVGMSVSKISREVGVS